MSEPAQGWYPDPSGAPQLRWWSGSDWTDYVVPYATQDQTVSSPTVRAQHTEVDTRDEAMAASPDTVPLARGNEQGHAPSCGADAVPMPIPSPVPEATTSAHGTKASSMSEHEASASTTAPARTTGRWVLACAASWILVAVFIGVLVFAWSHLGDSSRIYHDAEQQAQNAQDQRDNAQSTLDDINRQIEEAEK